MAFEKGLGVLRLGEDGFEKSVVGVRGDGEIRFFHEAEIRLTLRRRQESFLPGNDGMALI